MSHQPDESQEEQPQASASDGWTTALLILVTFAMIYGICLMLEHTKKTMREDAAAAAKEAPSSTYKTYLR